MVRELEVKKNGRRRAAASGLINFSTLSKFFFSFSSSSLFIHEEGNLQFKWHAVASFPSFTQILLGIYYSCLKFFVIFELKGTFCHVLFFLPHIPSYRVSVIVGMFFLLSKTFFNEQRIGGN